MSRRTAIVVMGLALLLPISLRGAPRAPANPVTRGAPRVEPSDPTHNLAGTGSCSARACHGGVEPGAGAVVQQNEYSTWLALDRHARSYETLLGERSRRMARNLGIPAAHRDVRCLACHTNPRRAEDQARAQAALDLGIGCEACHGPALGSPDGTKSAWLAEHTAKTWQALSPVEKESLYGMTALGDAEAQARTCAGCHVGAPAGDGLPARDLNHDLMAAGHPRLNFELSNFRVNLPPHWKPARHEATDPGHEARLWAVGQVVSARAALDLLADRVGRQPWPEFAEYDCFACHADLRSPSWRRHPDYLGGRKPGSAPYGTWFLGLLPVLGAEGPALVDLRRGMESPSPDPKQVSAQVRAGKASLDGLLARVKSADYTRAGVRGLLSSLAARTERVPRMSWDEAQQVVLAVAALDEAGRGAGEPDPRVQRALRRLAQALAFPADFNSPRDFRRREAADLDRELPELLRRAAP